MTVTHVITGTIVQWVEVARAEGYVLSADPDTQGGRLLLSGEFPIEEWLRVLVHDHIEPNKVLLTDLNAGHVWARLDKEI